MTREKQQLRVWLERSTPNESGGGAVLGGGKLQGVALGRVAGVKVGGGRCWSCGGGGPLMRGEGA